MSNTSPHGRVAAVAVTSAFLVSGGALVSGAQAAEPGNLRMQLDSAAVEAGTVLTGKLAGVTAGDIGVVLLDPDTGKRVVTCGVATSGTKGSFECQVPANPTSTTYLVSASQGERSATEQVTVTGRDAKPAGLDAPGTVNQWSPFTVDGEGWEPGTTQVEIRDPNGGVWASETPTVSDGGSFSFERPTDSSTTPGDYLVIVTDSLGTRLTRKVTVTEFTSSPKVQVSRNVVTEARGATQVVSLSGFTPDPSLPATVTLRSPNGTYDVQVVSVADPNSRGVGSATFNLPPGIPAGTWVVEATQGSAVATAQFKVTPDQSLPDEDDDGGIVVPPVDVPDPDPDEDPYEKDDPGSDEEPPVTNVPVPPDEPDLPDTPDLPPDPETDDSNSSTFFSGFNDSTPVIPTDDDLNPFVPRPDNEPESEGRGPDGKSNPGPDKSDAAADDGRDHQAGEKTAATDSSMSTWWLWVAAGVVGVGAVLWWFLVGRRRKDDEDESGGLGDVGLGA